MFELLITIFFVWLLFKGVGLALKLTWGLAKIVAGSLMVLALPLLIIFLIAAGGLILWVPVAMVCLAIGILKLCTEGGML